MNAPGRHEKQKRSMLKQYATYCITSATCCMDLIRPVMDKREKENDECQWRASKSKKINVPKVDIETRRLNENP